MKVLRVPIDCFSPSDSALEDLPELLPGVRERELAATDLVTPRTPLFRCSSGPKHVYFPPTAMSPLVFRSPPSPTRVPMSVLPDLSSATVVFGSPLRAQGQLAAAFFPPSLPDSHLLQGRFWV